MEVCGGVPFLLSKSLRTKWALIAVYVSDSVQACLNENRDQ